MIEKYRDLERADPTLLYAEDLKGKVVVLEIMDLTYEDVPNIEHGGTKSMLTVFFKGRDGKIAPKRLRLNPTNQKCWWAIFGKEGCEAVPLGKDIALFSKPLRPGECGIRIKGSSYLKNPITVPVYEGLKRVKLQLVPTAPRPDSTARAQESSPPPPVIAPDTCSSCLGEGCDRCSGSGRTTPSEAA